MTSLHAAVRSLPARTLRPWIATQPPRHRTAATSSKSAFRPAVALLALCLCGAASLARAQGLETFETHALSGTIYVDGSFTGQNGIVWHYYHVTGEQTFPIDGKGLLLRRSDAPSRVISGEIPGGIGSFSVQMRKAFIGAGDRQVELFVNGVSKGTSQTFGGATGGDDTIHTFSVADINVSGAVTIEVRHITGGSSSRQLVIDNLSWTGYAAAGPSLSVAPGSLSGFSYVEGGGPSPEMDYTVSGSGLMGTGGILVEPPAGFEVSTSSGSGFTDWVELPFADGELVDQPVTVYVRLAAGLDADDYSGQITHAGGGVDSPPGVVLSGTVSTPPPPLPALAAFDEAYEQDFSGFVSEATLPGGWSLDKDSYTYQGDFGSGTSGGLRGNGTLGFQLTTAAPNNTFATTLTLLNDTGFTIEKLHIAYLGRVAREVEGTPKWIVSVDGTLVPALEYSTAGGVDETKQTTLTGLAIAPGATFTIEWATTSAGTSGVRRQIGIGEVSVTATEDGEAPNHPPVLTLEPTSASVFAGEAVLATASATDADDDEVTLSVASSDIADVAAFFDPLTGSFAWTPGAAGTYVVTFTADDGEDQDAKDLTITVGLAAPRDLAAGPVGATTASVSWSPVAGATGYRVDVHAMHGEVAEVLAENFDGFVAGEYPGAHSTNVADALDDHTQSPGWSGERVYQAGGAVKLGVSSGTGWIQTPPTDLAAEGGDFTIMVDAGAWPTDTTNRSIDVLLDGGVLQTLELSNDGMRRFTITGSDGRADSVVRFTARADSGNRFFLDNLSIGTGAVEFEEVWAGQPVADASAALSDLAPGLAYRVVVRVTDGAVESADSEPLLFETAAEDTPPVVVIDPLAYQVELGELVSFLVTTFDAEGHAITLDMDLPGAALTETATSGVYRFEWLAATAGQTVVTFVATANGLESDPVAVAITVREDDPPAEPVAPRVQSITLSATEVEVVFAVEGGLEHGEGVDYGLWSAGALEGTPDWVALEAVFTPLDAHSAALTAALPAGETAFFLVRATR